MQYYRRSNLTLDEVLAGKEDVTHRELGDIPGILRAQDVFVWEDGHLVIKNPSKPYRPAY